MPTQSPDAIFPLTIFDDAWSPTNFATGWLTEGTIDEGRLRAALVALTDKWRLLAGRLEKLEGNSEAKWLVRVPLGTIPPDYATFSLTSRVSDVPLSRYVQLPIAEVSRFPPSELFVHSSLPADSARWASSKAPLTFWHLTHFPAVDASSPSHTCIGFAWPHGAFDGVGASLILHALEDELHGRPWADPFPLAEGYNENPLQRVLDHASLAEPGMEESEYKGMRVVPWWIAIFALVWCAWETWWLKAQYRLVVVPRKVYVRLAEEVRQDIRTRHGDTSDVDPRDITSGDVLTMFLFKALYDHDPRRDMAISCTYFIEFRKMASTQTLSLAHFPHNTFVPVSHPLTTPSALLSTPLPALARAFALSRRAVGPAHVRAAHRFLADHASKRGFFFYPMHTAAREALMVSNVSAQRIVELDWAPLGAGRTRASYRFNSAGLPIKFTRLFSIAGRLPDGSALIDGVLTERDWARVQREFEGLIARYS